MPARIRPSRPVFGSVVAVAADGLVVVDDDDPVLDDSGGSDGSVGSLAAGVVLESCGTVEGFGTLELPVLVEVEVEPPSGSWYC
jgi:hypothetical protein